MMERGRKRVGKVGREGWKEINLLGERRYGWWKRATKERGTQKGE